MERDWFMYHLRSTYKIVWGFPLKDIWSMDKVCIPNTLLYAFISVLNDLVFFHYFFSAYYLGKLILHPLNAWHLMYITCYDKKTLKNFLQKFKKIIALGENANVFADFLCKSILTSIFSFCAKIQTFAIIHLNQSTNFRPIRRKQFNNIAFLTK